MLLLTTTGRKTATPWTALIGYIQDDGSYVVIASNAGSDRHPGWHLNLQQSPMSQIQVGKCVPPVRAETVRGDQRQRLGLQVFAAAPGYPAYPRHTAREILLVILTPEDA